MDHIQDLTARAVSLITFIQDTLLKGSVQRNQKPSTEVMEVFGPGFSKNFKDCMGAVKEFERRKLTRDNKEDIVDEPQTRVKFFDLETKVLELVWFSKSSPNEAKKEIEKAEDYLVAICSGLADWIMASPLANKGEKLSDAFAPPQVWRDAISDCIYKSDGRRIALAEAMECLPIHLVLALGGVRYDVNTQRILQWWRTGKQTAETVLTEDEKSAHQKFERIAYESFADERTQTENEQSPDDEALHSFYDNKVGQLLSDYSYLIKRLLVMDAPLSFPYIFSGELDEIKQSRRLRLKECFIKESETTTPVEKPLDSHEEKDEDNCNPLVTAKDMNLFALAISGGGIRSATFSLGILQGLSKKGVLGRVDYLSTVSGGGYIGSWLATWIKRNGSLVKVQDSLNPEVSSDPLAEEVRPIRWLRMFSNYLSPDKSIMSIDTWTIAITWLRNTLLNQVVILFMLLSLLFGLRFVYELWYHRHAWEAVVTGTVVYILTCSLMLFLAYLTGVGMNWYNKNPNAAPSFRVEKKQVLTSFILFVAMLGAYLVSASLFMQPISKFSYKLEVLSYGGAVCFLVLLAIARIGRYDRCIKAFHDGRVRPWVVLVGTSLLAAATGWLAMAGVWKLFEIIKEKVATYYVTQLSFTIGIPLVLMVFGVAVVARMAFLGKYFPDERREWWGRMGATINRMAFIWLLVAAATTLLRFVFHTWVLDWKAPATVGGWVALVGGTVKAAFNAKSSGKPDDKGFQAKALDLLSLAGPYLFALGLLVFLPALIDPLLRDVFPDVLSNRIYLKALFYAIALFIPALYLSMRLGVNEFSMHHFYRNRLVRAYLGATRRKTSRDRTVNPFTGFDRFDDEKLSKFTNQNGYYGPYPVLNTALNASQVFDLSRQDRKAESFIFSPLYSGFDFSKVRSSANAVLKSYDYGYRPTKEYAYPNDNGPGIGTAMAISGAAANPNQGYHSSAGTAFLMTVFNVQLGWWIGNPRKSSWRTPDPKFGLAYVFYNLTGQTNTRNPFVCLSDGGHFDNMGIYEMVRRRCAFIVLCDGEQDENFTCEGLANAIRRCRIDFGAEISIDINDIVKRDGRYSKKHYAIGNIYYSGDKENQPSGKLLYIKSSLTGDEIVDVKEYAAKYETFPHQTTGDQFFDEQQFESYRKLGMHIADTMMDDEEAVNALKLSLPIATKEHGFAENLEQTADGLLKTLKNFFVPNH